ncbi:DDE Tnp4 domain-containing protein [Trichonephila clavipes]|nr:DDE Tnp4 domain-containing protein [Trichonephila clavipes]
MRNCHIQRPPNAGSLFYNYKDFHSIVLLAVADANTCFTMIEVGAYGKDNDSSIFTQSEMGKAYNAQQLNIPRGEFSLPGSTHSTEMYIVGNEAFPLQKNLMRPFPRRNFDRSRRNFNFRLSRARKSVECTFGILTKKSEILQSCIKTDIQQTDSSLKCICALHNFVRKQQSQRDAILEQELFPWEGETSQSLPFTSRRRGTNEAMHELMALICQIGREPSSQHQNDIKSGRCHPPVPFPSPPLGKPLVPLTTSKLNKSLGNAFVLYQKLGGKLSHLNFRLHIIDRLIESHEAVNEKKDDQEFCPVSYNFQKKSF